MSGVPSSRKRRRETVERLSISLPPEVARALDGWAGERRFANRSQAVAAMIREAVLEQRRETGEGIMTGTITLFFKQTRPGILEELAGLKRRCLDEVIGCLQVQLEDDHLMEVILVQGPAAKLQEITDELVACSGVKAGKLTLTSLLIPPLHPLPKQRGGRGK